MQNTKVLLSNVQIVSKPCPKAARLFPECALFDDMSLREELLRGIYAYGFERPSDIQKKGILPMISDRDVIVQERGGTGKTTVYLVGLLQRLHADVNGVQAIVLCPTRELSAGVERMLRSLGEFLPWLRTARLIGGQRVRDDIAVLEAGVHVVVGTPGRTMDMITRGKLKTQNVHTFVLDEVDELLERGFEEMLTELWYCLPTKTKCALFSATIPPELWTLIDQHLRNPYALLFCTLSKIP